MMSPTEPTKEAVAQRLRLAREQAGLSQGQVAKLLEMHRPTITEIEAGRRSVTAQEIARFGELYAVDLDWLLGADDGPETFLSAKARLAARELQQLRPKDLDRLLRLIVSLRGATRR
jgi:transcriptional regulator with XRE-family HTH domain